MDNLLSGFNRFSLQEPHALALHIAGEDYSYGDLRTSVTKIAAWLLQQKKCSTLHVGILGARSFESYAAVLSACWIGAMYVPLNPSLPLQRLSEMIRRADIHCLIVDKKGCVNLIDLCKNMPTMPILSLGCEGLANEIAMDTQGSLANVSPIIEPLVVNDEDFIYLMFTSGTTGQPKGVAATMSNLAHYLNAMQQRYSISPSDKLSQLFELSFDASAFDLFMAWNNGASLHVVPDAQVMAPSGFIQERKLTLWFGVPSTIAFLKKMKMLRANSFPSLRISLFGGEPLPVASVAAWHEAAPNSIIDNFYGPTETTVICFVQRCHYPYATGRGRDVLAIGQPYEGVFGGIVNEDLQFLPLNQSGQIVIGGAQVTPGYWQDVTLTEQKFRSLIHPQWGDGKWYLTGDQGYQDDAGVFHYLGRIDNQVKITGYRIELEEVEAHLREVCSCALVAVVAWPIVDGKALGLVGFVCGTNVSADAIKHAVAKRLPSYMVPKRIEIIPSMPYTVNGKVNRNQLFQWLVQEVKPTGKA